MYHRILVPTDGSVGTDRAIVHAIELATRYDAILHALYVVDETYPSVAHYDMVVEELEEQGEAAVEAVEAQAHEAGLTVEKHLRRGRPAQEILAAVGAYDIDLVVMGTHGRTGLDRVVHAGSVTERVVRGSPVAVLTTPLREPT